MRSYSDPVRVKNNKQWLPCATVSGIFKERCSSGLIKHSGLLCIDVDAKDNLHIPNFSSLQSELAKIKNVAYCGRSVYSGYFLVIPISTPENHLKHFLALQKLFKERYSIVIDRHCGNVDRLRTISYDENRYFNLEAIPFSSVLPDVVKSPVPYIPRYASNGADPVRKLQEVVRRIVEIGLDITGNEYDWWRIGCSITSVLDEDGRGIFHAVSQYYQNGKYRYSPQETDKKYDQCLRSKSDCSIGTFIWYFNKAMRENKL